MKQGGFKNTRQGPLPQGGKTQWVRAAHLRVGDFILGSHGLAGKVTGVDRGQPGSLTTWITTTRSGTKRLLNHDSCNIRKRSNP